MDFLWPTAMLAIAVFLLIVGLVGSGASMGVSNINLKIEGKVAGFPRIALISASGVALLLAIGGFIFVAAEKSNQIDGNPPPPSPPTTSTPIVSSSTTAAKLTLRIGSVMAQDAQSEQDVITIEGAQPLSLDENSSNPKANGVFNLNETYSGVHSVTVRVHVVYTDGSEADYSGSSDINIQDGLAYEVDYNSDTGVAGLASSG